MRGKLLRARAVAEMRRNRGRGESGETAETEDKVSRHMGPLIFKLGSRFIFKKISRGCDGENEQEGFYSLVYSTS